jgi:hypothetical protein
MDEQLLATLGRKQIDLEKLQERYNATVLELSRVASGEVDPSRLTVNLADGSWSRSALPEPDAKAS